MIPFGNSICNPGFIALTIILENLLLLTPGHQCTGSISSHFVRTVFMHAEKKIGVQNCRKSSFDQQRTGFTAPFNNMQNLKFISPPTVAFFSAVNHNLNICASAISGL